LGFVVNGHSFQGLLSHPNTFGIFVSFFIITTLIKFEINPRSFNLMNILLIVLAMYFIFLSKSRTSFITITFIIFLFVFLKLRKNFAGLIIYASLLSFIFLFIFSTNSIIIDFLFKGQDNFLFSRQNQLNNALADIFINPLFGNGFGVPALDKVSFSFSFDYYVEPGNLFLAVLRYSGIFGLCIFFIYLYHLFNFSFKKNPILIIIPLFLILLNLGEMFFFSTNGLGIWVYMFTAIYISI
jgi:hypothetical protein